MSKRRVDSEPGYRTFVVAKLVEYVQRCAEAEAQADMERKLRDDAIREAKAAGLSLAEIARMANVSRARVQQLAPTPETVLGDVEPEDDEALASAVS